MSSATTVLIYVPLDSCGKLVAHLLEVDLGGAGGGKGAGGTLFAGAFNYLPQPEFIDHLEAFDWPYPEATVVLFSHEYADHVSAWRPGADPNALREWLAGERP